MPDLEQNFDEGRIAEHFGLEQKNGFQKLLFLNCHMHHGAYSQNSNVSHHLSATLTVSPSEHLILDSQQNLRETLTLVTYILQNQLIPLS